MMSLLGKLTEMHGAFRFAVNINGVPHAVFTECTLPSLEVDVHEQKEGGYNDGVHLLPGRVKAGRITLKGGLTRSNEMLRWYLDVASGKPKVAQRRIDIMVLDSKGIPITHLTFEQAYPIRWAGPTLNAAQNELAVETLELAFSEVTFI